MLMMASNIEETNVCWYTSSVYLESDQDVNIIGRTIKDSII